jgi:hypothetical protein
MRLSLQVDSRAGSGADVNNWQPVSYRVVGLPPGETAEILITKVTHTSETFWKVDRIKPDLTLSDAGRYASAEDALRMLEKLYYPS